MTNAALSSKGFDNNFLIFTKNKKYIDVLDQYKYNTIFINISIKYSVNESEFL